MPYYTGDYYQGDCNYAGGDYYRAGDPFLGGLIGAVAKIGAPLLGKAVKAVVGLGRKKVATVVRQALPAVTGFLAGRESVGPESRILPGPIPGQVPEFDAPIGTMLPPSMGGFVQACGIKGTRPNKSSYYKRVPGTLQGVLIPKGSVCVKTRRMNIANGRALRRAVRRAQGFAKMARRVMTFVSAKAPKGRAKFKKSR